jgi:hypothetical protein
MFESKFKEEQEKVSSVADPDLGSGTLKNHYPDPGCSYFRALLGCGSGIRNLFDPGSGMEKNSDLGSEKTSRILNTGLKEYLNNLI